MVRGHAVEVLQQPRLLVVRPADDFATLDATIEQAARDTCDAVVPAGYDHNCDLDGPGEPQVETSYRLGSGECVGDCAYTDDCGDPDPYECENIGEGGEVNAGAYINCVGNVCDIDQGFAAMLWMQPSLLLSESTRLVYEPVDQRFEFASISVGTLAAELGFRDGDVLESVNSVIIDVASDHGERWRGRYSQPRAWTPHGEAAQTGSAPRRPRPLDESTTSRRTTGFEPRCDVLALRACK